MTGALGLIGNREPSTQQKGKRAVTVALDLTGKRKMTGALDLTGKKESHRPSERQENNE